MKPIKYHHTRNERVFIITQKSLLFQSKEDDQGGRYEYEYFVRDDHWGTNFGHKEYRDGKQTKGDYEVVLPDGRVQHVQYWSDASGYHASVTYHPLYRKYKHYKRQLRFQSKCRNTK